MDFSNKVVIVTGGTREIGFETVKAFKEKMQQLFFLDQKKRVLIKL